MSAPAEIQADLALAIRAARAAGEAVMRHFRQPREVRYKSPDQPVTEADLLADSILAATLRGERPHYGWLSEETADAPGRLSTARVWIVDPIDGTRSFLDGYPEFGLSIALVEEGKAQLGVFYNPASGELYHAVAGAGAFRNGQPIRVSENPWRSRVGVILASRAEIQRGELLPFLPEWRLAPLGSTAYKMVKVADGSGELYLSRGYKSEWDVCAGTLVVTEAGGRVTDVEGASLRFNRPDPTLRGILASIGPPHEAMLAQLAALHAGSAVEQAKGKNEE